MRNSEKIRLWISNNAFDRCALYWFSDYVKKCTSEVYVVLCQGIEFCVQRNQLIENTRWAGFENLEHMASFSQEAKLLSSQEVDLYSRLWKKLVDENAPLRILIDNKVISTTEDFFDQAILNYITLEPKPQITVINEFLKEHLFNTNQ